MGPEGQVIGIEHIEQLVEASERNLSKEHPDWLENERVKFVAGDGRKGYPEGEFYDCM